jgi:hypothetical protein
MPLARKWTIIITAAAIWTTGAAWLGLHYFARVEGPFGPEPHPAEAWVLRAHGAFAFASLWVLGLLWAVHVTPGWARGKRRLTGGLMFAAAALLALTGYLLYYLGDETLRADASLLHWAIGAATLVAFLVHGVRFK